MLQAIPVFFIRIGYFTEKTMVFKRCRMKKILVYLAAVSVFTTFLIFFTLKERKKYPVLGLMKNPNLKRSHEDIIMDVLDTKKNHSRPKESVMESYLKFLGNNVTSEELVKIRNYYQVRNTRVNPIDYTFMGNVRNGCDTNRPPFLLIMCISKPENILRRNSIRKTWGQVKGLGSLKVKLVFIVGKPENAIDDAIEKEERVNGDIVRISVLDTYRNLTRKVMMGLKWTSSFCNGAKFFMKVDDDCFVHVQNAIRMLADLNVPPNGIIVGFVNFKHHVQRADSKWTLTKEEFPFRKMPLYASGQTYVISGNIIDPLFYAGERMPYISIEDGFITGILRTVIGSNILPMKGFPQVTMTPASPCSFHNKVRISATNIKPEQMMKIWENLDVPMADCYKCETLRC